MAEADRQRQLHRLVLPVGARSATTSPIPVRQLPPIAPHHRDRRGGGGVHRRVNPCLAAEARWAGGGLNLYVYLTYGRQASGDPACATIESPAACNYGFNAAARRLPQGGRPASTPRWPGGSTSRTVGPSGPPATAPPTQSGPGGHRRAPLRGAQQGRHLRQPGRRGTASSGLLACRALWVADWGHDPAAPATRARTATPGAPTGPPGSSSTARRRSPRPRRRLHVLRRRLRLLSRDGLTAPARSPSRWAASLYPSRLQRPPRTSQPVIEAWRVRSPSRAAAPPATGSLASREASTTPAWQATTTSRPGWRATSRVEGAGHPEHEPGPALAPRGDGLVGVLVPVDRGEPSAELRPGQPIGLPGVELAQAALGHQAGRRAQPPGAVDRTEGRRQQLGRLDGPGQHAGVEGSGPGQLPAGRAAGHAGPPPAGARGR